jgi:ketosteroid isomerase-like protein
MLGGIVGIFAINAYQRRVASQSTAQSTNAPRTSDKLATAPTSATTQNDAGARANSAATSIPTAPATRDDQTASVRTATTGANAGGGNGQTSATQAHVDNPEKQQQGAGEDGARELRAALGEWITATNARDIDRQMNFYEPRVAAFYLTRNVSREAVRAEKSNVFARASAVDVRADDPQITLSPDGRTATMRFRKEYSIEGGGQDRRGAVIQELRWRRTPAGWKITSERDLRIVN